MSNYLTEILQRKQLEVKELPRPLTFQEALMQNPLAVIAEIKRKSPSKGILNSSIDPAELAQKYVAGGAAAISVLTDREGFGGSLEDLQAVVKACPGTPVLRKDFIIDLRQLYETARSGAHAVLLIVAALGERLPEFLRAAKEYGLETLVEVHDLGELYLAQSAQAKIIGVNNRNLETFEISLNTAEQLAPYFSEGIIKVAESGIENRDHAKRMRKAGYNAVLIGESLVKAKDPQALVKELCHVN